MRPVRLLTGPIRSGKTTRLRAWAAGRSDVAGVLSPDGPNGREFVDPATGERMPMERPAAREAVLAVGRFRFRRTAFDWASERLLAADADSRIRHIVVDEIGPIELAGDGFAPALRHLLRADGAALVLVVRDTLAARVGEAFAPHGAELFREGEVRRFGVRVSSGGDRRS